MIFVQSKKFHELFLDLCESAIYVFMKYDLWNMVRGFSDPSLGVTNNANLRNSTNSNLETWARNLAVQRIFSNFNNLCTVVSKHRKSLKCPCHCESTISHSITEVKQQRYHNIVSKPKDTLYLRKHTNT